MAICAFLWLSAPPAGNKEDTTTLHVLGLLKELLGTFPLGAVKSCCETLLRVMTLSHVVRTESWSQVRPQTGGSRRQEPVGHFLLVDWT